MSCFVNKTIHLFSVRTKFRPPFSTIFEGEQIVVLSQVLANEVNIGYEDMSNEQVLKFNGTRIKNINHLTHLVDSCKDKYLVFEFEDNYLVILEREASSVASPCILKDYGIPSERSADLLEPYIDIVEESQATDQQNFGEIQLQVQNLALMGFFGRRIYFLKFILPSSQAVVIKKSAQVRGKFKEMEGWRRQEQYCQEKIIKAKENLAAADLEFANLPHFEPKNLLICISYLLA